MENQNKKSARPFGLNFVEVLADEELEKICGDGRRLTTLALSIRILPNGRDGHTDET